MDDHKKVCPLEMIQCKYHCGIRIARNEVKNHNQEKLNEHIQLAHNTLSELIDARSFETSYKIMTAFIKSLIIVIIALLLQSYYTTTDYSLKQGGIVQLQNEIRNLKVTETEHLENLRQSELLVRQLQNEVKDLKVTETEHLENLTRSESLVKQLQNEVKDLKVTETEHLENLTRSESLVKQLRNEVKDLKVKETGHLEHLRQSESLVKQLRNEVKDLKVTETENLTRSESLVKQLRNEVKDLKVKETGHLEHLRQSESLVKQLRNEVKVKETEHLEHLRQSESLVKQLQNEVKVKETEHLEHLRQSESLVKQLQNEVKVKETEHLEHMRQSESLVKQLQNDIKDLKGNVSINADNCESDKLAQTESKLKQLFKSVYISYNSNHDDGSLWPLILSMSNEIFDQVGPLVILKMPNFSKLKKNKEIWHSNSFFAFQKGYQICLEVFPMGNDKGTHVSVHLYLMKGPHDDELKQSGHWPMRGTFTVELLNQLNDSHHHSHVVQSHHYLCSKCTNRVLKRIMAERGLGTSKFISHKTLLHHNSGYSTNDSLVFRISYEDMELPHQIAPVTFKITHFLSQWLKNKGTWYSSPFLAFEGGYQMFLTVNAAGDDEGTHISVYLYLMKGPHDDKLEQSGHWPLRGTFTIEVLNQLNDNGHHSRKVIFTPNDACNRVVNGIYAPTRWGHSQFMSHDILLHHKYLKNDVLYFRIIYQDVDLGGISALLIVVSIIIIIFGQLLLCLIFL